MVMWLLKDLISNRRIYKWREVIQIKSEVEQGSPHTPRCVQQNFKAVLNQTRKHFDERKSDSKPQGALQQRRYK